MIPQNEMGVIVVFSQQAYEAGFEIVSIGCEFPDAIIKRGDKVYRVEFEYKSSNFIQHRHDPRDCDLIICWTNDTPDYTLPILALSNPRWKLEDIIAPDDYKVEVLYWRQRALKAERLLPKQKSEKLSKEESLKAILRIVASDPYCSLSVIAGQIGRPKSTAGNYVNELQQTGKLHKNGEGWKVENDVKALGLNGNGAAK